MRPFSCVSGSNPVERLASTFFAVVFPVNRRYIYRYFGPGQELVIDRAVKLDAGPPLGSSSNQRSFDSLLVRWFLVEGSSL